MSNTKPHCQSIDTEAELARHQSCQHAIMELSTTLKGIIPSDHFIATMKQELKQLNSIIEDLEKKLAKSQK